MACARAEIDRQLVVRAVIACAGKGQQHFGRRGERLAQFGRFRGDLLTLGGQFFESRIVAGLERCQLVAQLRPACRGRFSAIWRASSRRLVSSSPSLTKITAAAPCSTAFCSFRRTWRAGSSCVPSNGLSLSFCCGSLRTMMTTFPLDVDAGVVVVGEGLLAAFEVLGGDAVAGEDQRRIERAACRRWPAA